MVNLSRDELIRELEDEAEKIHNSTRVDMPFFSPMHNYFRSKSEAYYKWSISPKSNNINKTTALGFVFSVFFFTLVQFVFPNLFLPKANKALAGSSSITWTTKADFEGVTSKSNIIFSGDNDSLDINNNDSASLAPSVSLGTGLDGDITITSGSPTIESIYENDNVLGVTTIRGVGKGLFKGNTYNPSTDTVPNFNNFTVNTDANLTTTAQVAIEFKVLGTLTIQTGATINANVMGYSTGAPGSGQDSYGGAAYGGAGGDSIEYDDEGCGGGGYWAKGSVYGAYPSAINFGSGHADGRGGGLIDIAVNNSNIQGSVTANGGLSGSGGGISVFSPNTVSMDKFFVNGGNGNGPVQWWNPNNTCLYTWHGGGGGGGRIFANVPSASPDTPSVNRAGGTGYQTGGVGTYTEYQQTYLSPGFLGTDSTTYGAGRVGLRFEAPGGKEVKPSTLNWDAQTQSNSQKIYFKVRAGNDQTELDNSACYGPEAATVAANCYSDWTTSGAFFSQINLSGTITTNPASLPGAILSSIPAKKYVEIIIRLESDGLNTPTLNSVTLGYDYIDTPTDLKSYRSDDNSQISTWTNGNVVAKADIRGVANGSTLTPQFEIRTDTNFLGTPAVPSGVTMLANNIVYTGDGNTWMQDQSLGTLSGFSSGLTYYYKIRITDSVGRVSSWSDTYQTISMDQIVPTGTVTIKNGDSYTNSTSVPLTLSATDTGGSGVSQMRFSNDGTTWSEWETYSTSKTWTLAEGDGQKTVYAQFKDGAGNVSGKNFSSKSDWDSASSNDIDTSTIDGSIQISTTGGETPNYGSSTTDLTISSDTDISSLIAGYNGTTIIPEFRNLTINSRLYTQATIPLAFRVSGTLTINSGGLIDANGKGLTNTGSVGGGYGGAGGMAFDGYDSVCYGSPYPARNPFPNPIDFGNGPTGGGGKIKIHAASIIFSGTGTITANGNNGAGSQIGAGSGGGIHIVTGNTLNASSIKALGGTGLYSEADFSSNSGSGGGGRIYLQAPSITNVTSGNVAGGPNPNPNPGYASCSTGGIGAITQITSNYKNLGILGGTSTGLRFGNPILTTKYKYTGIKWNGSDVTSTYKIKVQIRPSDTWGSGDTGYINPLTGDSTWYEITSNSGIIPINNSLAAFKTLEIRLELIGDGNDTPKLDDFAIEIAETDVITYDANSPVAFLLSSPADNSWQNNGSPTFSWDASSDGNGISKYQLYINDVLNKDNIANNVTSTTATSSLIAGTYTWYIRAYDVAGNYTNSDIRTVKVDLASPVAPVLSGTAISEAQINLSWSGASDDGEIDQFLIERSCLSCDPVTSFEQVGTATGVSTTYSDTTGLSAGNTYLYKVKAIDKVARESVYSNEKELSTIDTIAPQQPAGLQVFTTMFGDRLNLSFLGGKDGVKVDKYYIYASLAEFGEYVKVSELDIDPNVRDDSTTTRSITISNLVDNKEYWFKVSALDEVGNESAKTAAVSGTPPDTTTPQLPVDFSIQVTATSSSTIDLSWTAATDFSSDGQTFGSAQDLNGFNGWYTVERSTNNVDWSPASSLCINIQTESCTDEGLSALTTYHYRVKAIDKAGSSIDPINVGNWVSSPQTDADNFAKTYTDAVPTSPINLSVNFVSGTQTTIQFTGAASSKIGGTPGYELQYYKIYRFVGTEQSGAGSTTNEQLADWITKNNATQVGSNITVSSQGPGTRSGSSYEFVDNNTYAISDTNLTNASTYRYKVVAFDTTPDTNIPAGPFASPLSSTYVVTTPDIEIPSEFDSDSFKVEADVIYGSTISNPRIVVNWIRVPEILRSTIASVSSDNNTNIVVSSGHGTFFSTGQFIKIGSEILKITNIATDTLTVSRAQASTTQSSHQAGSVVSILDFSSYRLFKDSGIGYQEITSQSFNSPELNYFVDASIEEGKTYSYKVTILDSASTFKGYRNNQPNQIIQAQNNESLGKETTPLNPNNIDTVAPVIVGDVIYVTPGVSTATISWDTNENASTTVLYGLDADSYTEKAGNISTQDSSEVLKSSGHQAVIKGLSAATTYYYKVISDDASKNSASKTGSFATLSFIISDINTAVTSSSATISWNTNIDSNTYVEFKKASSSEEFRLEGSTALAKNHQITLTNLTSGIYTYNVKSYDSENNLASQSLKQFEIPTSDLSAFGTPQTAKVEEKEITATSAKVTWTSTIATTSWVDYGTVKGIYGKSAGNNDYTLNHIVTLEGLVPDTTYYYVIRGLDTSGIEYVSQEYSFKALAEPAIFDINVNIVNAFEVIVRFKTNIKTDTGISYGKDSGYGKRAQSSDLTTNHEIKLTDIEDDTSYNFQIDVRDEAGNSVKSQNQVFTTPQDKVPPQIKDVKLSPLSGSDSSKRGIIITWTTDKESSSQIQYSSGITQGSYNQKSPEDPSLTLSHTVVINSLDPGTTYHFQLLSKDKRGNLASSPDYTMLTQEQEESVLNLILNTLQETFSWVGKIGDWFSGAFSTMFSR